MGIRTAMKLPSPATTISCVALFVASGGTAVAAISYATNAGAVDGKSAVASGASTKDAAGRLVATQRSGDARGKIDDRYLDLRGYARASTATFGRSFEVSDNAQNAPTAIGSIPGFGAVQASCIDQNGDAGVEDPATTITFVNQSGTILNLARQVGNNNANVGALANGTQSSFTVGGSDTFELHAERSGINYFVRGTIRQDGRGTNAGSCLVYGFSLATAG